MIFKNFRKISLSAILVPAVLVLVSSQWQCSRKDSDDSDEATENTYIPSDWDGISDWGSSKYKVEDL